MNAYKPLAHFFAEPTDFNELFKQQSEIQGTIPYNNNKNGKKNKCKKYWQ